MDSINKSGLSFRFAILGEHCPTSPPLLGRDNAYKLNVKLVDQDGMPVSGMKYSISSDNEVDSLVYIEGMDNTYTSSPAGQDFYIEGLPATTEAHVEKMQCAFSVECKTEGEAEQVVGCQELRMGRLLRWGHPGISVTSDKAVFSTKTERVAKESGLANWNWGEKIDQCTINLGASIEGSGATSFTENGDKSFRAAPEIDLDKFSSISKASLQLQGGLSNDQFTAVLPFAQNDVELYYFESVAFSQPSMIVGVPAKVTCKLVGLDRKPRANVDVDWSTNLGTVDPAASKTDAQGIAETVCTSTVPGTATVTVVSKAQRTVRGTSAATPVGPLLIVDPLASATEYIEGHSDPIQFSVTLTAGGQPVSGLTVEWFVNDSVKDSGTSDSEGKARCNLTFTPGADIRQVVKASVVGTQVQTSFDVDTYAVELTDPKVSATEYVITHSPDIEFSVVLKAGTQLLSGVEVAWSVGSTTVTSKSDSAGKVTFKQGFETPGDHTITVKEPKSGKSRSFAVKAYAIVIDRFEPKSTEFILGQPAVTFSVWLKANGKALPNKKVEWSVTGAKQPDSTTDSSGKATFAYSFTTEGTEEVVAKPAGLNESAKFSIVVHALVFTAKIEGEPPAFDLSAPDLLSRSLKYQISVTVSNSAGKPVSGVRYSLTNPGPAYASIGLSIKGLNDDVVSTTEPHLFEISTEPWNKPESFTFRVVHAGSNVFEATYRLGWIFNVGYAVVYRLLQMVGVYYAPLANAYTGKNIVWEAYTGSIDGLFDLELYANFQNDYVPVGAGMLPSEVPVGTLLRVSRAVAMDGYAVLNAGTTSLGGNRLSESEERSLLSSAEYKLLSEADRVTYGEHLRALIQRLKE